MIVVAAALLLSIAPDQPIAQEILDAADFKGGLIVHLGCGDGRLTAALHTGDHSIVYGLEGDPKSVEAARKTVRDAGLYGLVSIHHLNSERLPFADNMVNLVVAGEQASGAREQVSGARCQVSAAEIRRVLAPGGCIIRIPSDTRNLTPETSSPEILFRKPWPAEIDQWNHWLHGADSNAVAEDTVVGPPRRMQWIAKPFWSRHHHTVPSVSAIVSSGGRLYYIVDEAPASMDGSAPDKWMLVARDAFNGMLLWKKPMPDWGWRAWSAEWTCRFTVPTHLPRRLVAMGDRVYVTLGFNAPLTELDGATGRVLREFEGTPYTDEILHLGDRLVLSINQQAQHPTSAGAERRGESVEPPVKKWVAAIDVASGRMLWKTGDFTGLQSKTGSMDRINHLSMCAGDGRAFLVDHDRIVCLATDDGRELWNVPRPAVPENKMRYDIRITDMCSLVYHDGAVYFAQLDPDRGIDWREIRGRIHAFSAATGEERWNRPCASWGWGHPADVFIVDGLVWIHGYEGGPRTGREGRPNSGADLARGTSWVGTESALVLGLDPATGEVRRSFSKFEPFNHGHHHRCYRNKATTNFMLTGFRGIECLPWDGEPSSQNHWVRGTCRLGPIPCNGMIYATPHPCDCYISSKLNGVLALGPASDQDPDQAERAQSDRLTRGPTFGPPALPSSASNLQPVSWPTYRHDPNRSGSTKVQIDPQLDKAWEATACLQPTACVATDDLVVTADARGHRVVALSATTGEVCWSFTPDGPIDTPPTLAGSWTVFGCLDGYVYCLRSSDGGLAWRFRAAPEDRWIGAFGGIESAWPVHGSVIVQGNTASFVAGRSSFLDGGMYAFRLNLATGQVLAERHLATPHDMPVDTGRNQSAITGLLSDVLVVQGDSIFMRNFLLFPDKSTESAAPVLRSTAGLLDASWFSRTRWFLDNKAAAEYLVFDGEAMYGVSARKGMNVNAGWFSPGGKGYELFRRDRGQAKNRWSISVPVRVTAMVLAGDTLFAAGSPDAIDPDDPWAAYEGRRGGKLLAIEATTGEIQAEYDLPAPPVLDGVIAVEERLIVSTQDGKVICFGE